MPRSYSFTGSVLALGILSALAFTSVGRAADKKQAAPSSSARIHGAGDFTLERWAKQGVRYQPREIVEFTFQKIEAAQFNPKELSVDKSVPWKQSDSSATQVRKAVDRVLKRGAQPTANDVALEKVTLVHEGIERR
jgi:hypothetical protein